MGDTADSGVGCSTGPTGYIGWRRRVRTSYASVDCTPQSGTKNVATGFTGTYITEGAWYLSVF
jgi:hypothetical protein